MHITVGRLITKHASLNYNDFRSLIHLIQAYIRIQQTWIIDMHYTQKLSEQQLYKCYNICVRVCTCVNKCARVCACQYVCICVCVYIYYV
jgi:hypothetical protein